LLEGKRSLKILRIITRLNIGGPAQHAVFLTVGLNNGLLQSKLVFGAVDQSEGDMSYLARGNGIAFTEIGSLKNEAGFLGNLRAFLQLYQLILREKPDLVHLHLLKARFLGGLAARVAGVPLVLETLHGDLFTDYYGYFKTQAILMAERLLGHLIMDKVIAISGGVKESILRSRIASASKVEVIPLGLELEKFMTRPQLAGELRRELGIQEGNRLVGIVGRMVPIKGHRNFLQAASEVLRSCSNVRFVLVGDGLLRREMEMECQLLGITEAVTFLGWRRDLDKIYADLDMVVMSSLNEGTPVSLIEAMAAGKAVVATRVGGVPDVVEDGKTGLLVPPKDPKALADAILRLLNDGDLRRSLGERARVSVFPKYDVSRLVQDMKDFYLNIVPSREKTDLPKARGSMSA